MTDDHGPADETTASASPRRRRAGRKARNVPGPSTNPATNLLIADVALRSSAMLLGRVAEKGLLRARFDPEKVHDIVAGRSMGSTLVTTAVARMATRSIPGFLLVTGGLLAKSVVDRSLNRRKSRRKGDRKLLRQAENAPD
ncbi:MAG: hypothetical protein RLZZ08_609 [Pseudomonadota bacterium]|jgi:hypothetical protein